MKSREKRERSWAQTVVSGPVQLAVDVDMQVATALVMEMVSLII